jgi:hypothetical protein
MRFVIYWTCRFRFCILSFAKENTGSCGFGAFLLFSFLSYDKCGQVVSPQELFKILDCVLRQLRNPLKTSLVSPLLYYKQIIMQGDGGRRADKKGGTKDGKVH